MESDKNIINLLIADDNPLIRKSIRVMISDHYPEKEISIYEAENGEEALEFISSIHIDILLSDIKMPKYTGIELLQRLNELGYRNRIIILSGFDDYNLVRSSMKLGASDYLLKPIVQEEFLSILDNLFSKIEKENKEKHSFVGKESSALKLLYENQYCIDQLLLGNYLVTDNANENTPSILILIEMTNDEKAHLEFSRDVYSKYCFQSMHNHITDQQSIIQGEYKGFWIIILFHAMESDYEYIQPFLASYTENSKKACCSKIFELFNFEQALLETSCRIDHIFYNMPRIPASTQEDFPYDTHFVKLEKYACGSNYSDFSVTLKDLFLAINFEKCSVIDIKRILAEFVYQLMQKDSRYIRIIGQYRMSEQDIFLCINDSFCLTALLDSLLSIFNIYMQQSINISESQEISYIKKATDFIEQEYSNNITIGSVANYLNLHPNYFSSIFKKENGLTFTEHLRKIRIEKSCELMLTTNKKLYEIAYEVGYHDNLQFNRAFHRVTGVSPSNYRKK